ncbi:hypothetical protein [Bradyrhizobium erythrophlei]|uniref:hypothetical protein n=1 Tax=Bradyrhizobium erythrophlei TaxID=1437360 RepID=UPI001561838B|nr:hypothetical protein [Bradyrhizobium erythrophlei]
MKTPIVSRRWCFGRIRTTIGGNTEPIPLKAASLHAHEVPAGYRIIVHISFLAGAGAGG